MVFLFILYLVWVVYTSILLSRKGRFYIFSPFVVVYLGFAVSDIIPLLMYDSAGSLPSNIPFVTNWATIINFVMIILFRKDFFKKMDISPPSQIRIYNNRRKVLIISFLLILVGAGIYSGVTISILSGGNVENLRRTSEIGMGFITMIPYFAIFLLILQMLFCSPKISIFQAGLICFIVSVLLFFTNAARAQFVMGISVFFIWFNIKYRALKWYEYYVLFYLLSPIVATFLLVFRGEGGAFNINEILFAHQNMIFLMNTKSLMTYFDGSNGYLMGMSYIFPITTFIPRFLWAEKPLSIDYYYKEITGMDFDGGGIYTTLSMEMYLNFGQYFMFFYAIWLLFIHFLYRKALSENTNYTYRISLMYFLTLFVAPDHMIAKLEVYILFLIICRWYYGKKRII